jgi:phosphatidylinositol 4-kinase
MFTHQLIWSLRTEEIDKKELTSKEISELTEKDYEMAAISVDLIKEITNSFSEEQKELYLEEFGFFDKVTNISGYLKKIEKEKRPEQIAVEVQKLIDNQIKQSKNLYLPTSVKYNFKFLR